MPKERLWRSAYGFFPINPSMNLFLTGEKFLLLMQIFKNNWDNYFRVNYSYQEI